MEFQCPNCLVVMADDGTFAGRVAACPQCGQLFTCPGSPSINVVDNIVQLPNAGNYNIGVVGVMHYQHELETICGGRRTESVDLACQAFLVLDDHNAFDQMAVRVSIGETLVGHLSQGAARRWRAWLKRHNVPGFSAACGALIVGGWYRSPMDMGHFGVRLALPLRDSIYD